MKTIELDPITQARGFSLTHQESPDRSDGGGKLIIQAYTPEARLAVINHFGSIKTDTPEGAQAFIGALNSPDPYTVSKSYGNRDNAAYFLAESSLDLEFSLPYFRELNVRTGYTGRGILPDLSAEFLTPRYKWQGLCHTHYMAKVWAEGGHLCYSAIVGGSDWNNRAAADNADRYAADSVAENVGTRYQEPEFRYNHNGTYSPNPAYLKRHPAKPALNGDWFWPALVDWWLENEASDAQRELVRVDGELMAKNHRGVSSLHNLRERSGLRRDWESKVVTWAKFRALA